MRLWCNKIGQSNGTSLEFSTDRIQFGRSADNDVVLNSHYVSERAALLSRVDAHWVLTNLGTNDILIGQRELRPGEQGLIDARHSIQIFPFSLRLELDDAGLATGRSREELDDRVAQMVLDMHRGLLKHSESAGQARDDDAALIVLEGELDELARMQGLLQPSAAKLRRHIAGLAVLGAISEKIIETSGAKSLPGRVEEKWSRLHTLVDGFEQELDQVCVKLRGLMALDRLNDISLQMDALERHFWDRWESLVDSLYDQLIEYLARRYLKKQVKDIVFGYGPLEDLLRIPNISEIMVVDSERIYVEKGGVLEKSGRRFPSDDITETIIDRIVSRVGRRIDKSQPLVDARLADGSRVNAVIMPLAVSGPCLTIRKFPLRKLTVDDLIQRGALTQTASDFLQAAVTARRNILVSGGTGSGKTTLLNCLSNFIPDKERIVTIEDTAELQLHKEHVVRLETKSANVEGAGAYTMRDLVKNSLRMRPDRIVVGETRGAEALDMLQAMNTGHDGSMTTIHANSSSDALLRLEVLVQIDTDMPVESIHRQIASAVNLIVQLKRMRDGSRKVSQISELLKYEGQGKLRTKDIFALEETPAGWQLMPTGALPTFMDELIASELIDLEAFYL